MLLSLEEYKDKYHTDIYTLEDVVASLKKPNLDPRDEYPQPILKSNILDIKDLKCRNEITRNCSKCS